MTTAAINSQSNLLQGGLRTNAIFSAVSGAVLLIGAQPAADFFGLPQPMVLRVIGVLLFVWAAFAAYVAAQQPISRTLAWLIIAGDLIWVLGSVILLAADPFDLTTGGKWVIALLADVVLVFAIVQTIGVRRLAK